MAKKATPKKQTPAPVPEPVPEPVVKQVNTSVEETPIEMQFKEVLNTLNEQKNLITTAINNVKQLQKNYLKETKNKKKKRTSDPTKKRAPSGFAKPTKISKELCDFLSKPNGTEMARTEVTKYLTEYIKNNNLQWEQDRRKIVPDKKLSKLLNCEKNDDVTYFNLQKWMKPHFASKTVSA